MTTKQEKRQGILKSIIDEVSKVVIGKENTKELLLVALLSQGHVLIEGLPGTAKTTIARTFAHAIGGKFKRVQGTPDMLPADILGFYLYRSDGSATFMPGPIFANVLLADELNRTTPRTQAALLEAMQERQVTIERETHTLEQPFIVIASQVPYGGPGTSPLSDVQSDRFMFRLWSTHPNLEEEDRILRDIDAISEPHIAAVATPGDIIRLQQEVKKVHVTDSIRRYILDIINSLRNHQDIQMGPSTRAGIALLTGARALAFIHERDFVIPDDVKRLLVPVLSHRIQINAEAEMENVSPDSIIDEVASEVIIPKEGAVSSPEPGDKSAPETARAMTATPVPAVIQEEESIESLTTAYDEAVSMVEEDHQETVNEASPTNPLETTDKAEEASRKTQWQFLKALPEWEWILIISAVIIAAIMISIGLLSF